MRFIILLISLLSITVHAEESNVHTDESKRLKIKQVITGMPHTALRTLKAAVSKEAILPWAAITGTTMFLWTNDQNYVEDVQRWGRDLHIGNAENTKTAVSAGPYPLMRLPSDTGSALYFLGDGWTHFSIAGGFLLNGYFYEDHDRAWNTGLQIVHGMFISTIFNQALKRSTGRETPSKASEPRGKWRPFPSTAAYNKTQPKYDAFPSGHVMTASLVFTVIAENYPEYKWYTIPVGTVWCTLLALQMMNNGVHWASDYPLGLAMGITFGHFAAQLGKPDKPEDDKKASFRPVIYPSVAMDGTETINALFTF
jgi:membrane-associated phospholipid phosphatase